MRKLFAAGLLLLSFVILAQTHHATASNTINFQATINPGSLVASVRNSRGEFLDNPTVDFGRVINSIECRNKAESMKTVLGTDDVRIYVENPKAAMTGWTLSLAPGDGASTQWRVNQRSLSMDINDPASDGCIDSDGDGAGGLLTIDPSGTQLYSDCRSCSTQHIVGGQRAHFGEAPAVTLLRASELSDVLGRWYITGILVEQTIPDGQEGATYSLPMVLTATAT